MNKFLKTTVCLSALLCCYFTLYAQHTVPASGGNATGSTGTVSYTIGQTVYNSHSSPGGTSTQGIQQGYEITIQSGIDRAKSIYLQASVYPNPTSDILKLKIDKLEIKNLTYFIYDIKGELLYSSPILYNETKIAMNNYLAGTYLIKIAENKNEIKVFKIIKN